MGVDHPAGMGSHGIGIPSSLLLLLLLSWVGGLSMLDNALARHASSSLSSGVFLLEILLKRGLGDVFQPSVELLLF